MNLSELLTLSVQMVYAWVAFFVVTILYRFIERKALADIEARIGPRRVGMSGLFQPAVDWVKILAKAGYGNRSTDRPLLFIGSLMLLSALCALPLGGAFPLLDSSLNSWVPLILFFLMSQLFSLVDLRSGNLVSMLSGVRRLILFFGFFLPAVLSVLHVYLVSGGSSWAMILEQQQKSWMGWNALANPLGALSAFVFIISGVALASVHPFSVNSLTPRTLRAPLIEDFLSFFCFFLWSALSVGLFFGGPGSFSEYLPVWPFSILLLFKVLFLMMLVRMLGSSFSRLRMDQAVRLAWGFLVPLAAAILMLDSLWIVKRGLG